MFKNKYVEYIKNHDLLFITMISKQVKKVLYFLHKKVTNQSTKYKLSNHSKRLMIK